MAHSAQETPGHEARLRSSAERGGIRVDWMFRCFAEHAELIARSAGVDAVLVGEASARRHFPGWHWTPLDRQEPNAVFMIWAAWADPDLADLRPCLVATRAAGDALGDGSPPSRYAEVSPPPLPTEHSLGLTSDSTTVPGHRERRSRQSELVMDGNRAPA
jgi:hypothetical protein